MSTNFTVVIPTRERCDTLEWALKTCVTQQYDQLRIIVSDNDSADRTEEVVRSFNDPRITYLNTGRRLSMTDNFEFALSHVADGFVIFIGDDDGLLPNALIQLDAIITAHHCQAITWQKPDYFWPTFLDPNYANVLRVPLASRDTIEERNCAAMLSKVADFKVLYTSLPIVYHGCVDSAVIRRITERTGRFFHSSIPDAYSAIALSCALDTYHYSTQPFSITGLSGHSAGAGYLSSTQNVSRDRDNAGARWFNENTVSFHPDLVMFPSLPILTAESFFQVRDHLGYSQMRCPSIEQIIDAAAKDESLLLDRERHANLVAVITQIAAIHGREAYAEAVIQEDRRRFVPRLAGAALRLIFSGTLSLSGAKLGVANVYEASLWCEHIRTLYRPWYLSGPMHLKNYIERAIHVIRKGRASR